jgi:hypothetical protein
MTWLITREDKDYGTVYWTGEFTKLKEPSRTKDKDAARKFDTASEAYALAQVHPKLQGWRVRRA